MTDQDRCTDTNPHPAHRTQYGGFGTKDCPGVPMTSREELREERVTTGRLEGDLRSQTRALREALAERDEAARICGEAGIEIDRLRAERDEATEDRDLLRAENANLTAGLRRLREQLAEAHADCARYANERDEARAALGAPLREAAKHLRLLADDHAADSLGFGIGWAADALDAWAKSPDEAPPAVLGSADRRAQEPTAGEARRLLDQAIESALPLAGGRVRKRLKALRRELVNVDAKRAGCNPAEG